MDVHKKLLKNILALFLPLFLLSGCAGKTPDSRTAEEHRQRAEELVFAKDYSGAADELNLALRQEPGEGSLYLRLGELLEVLGETEDARGIYEKGMRTIAKDTSRHREIAYRLALLYASKLNRPEQARELLAEFPEGSVVRFDLEAAIAIAEGDGREALGLLNQALQQKVAKPMAARILFHAAQAYDLLGDQESTSKSLYQAINIADQLGTVKDIETFWREWNSPTAPAR